MVARYGSAARNSGATMLTPAALACSSKVITAPKR